MKAFVVSFMLVATIVPTTAQARCNADSEYCFARMGLVRGVMRELPECAAKTTDVHIIEDQRDFPGYELYANRQVKINGQIDPFTMEMYLFDHQTRDEFRDTVIHECGHIVDYGATGLWRLRKRVFGYKPFLSEYAETNMVEDFAETYLFMKTKPRLTARIKRRSDVMREKFLAIEEAIESILTEEEND